MNNKHLSPWTRLATQQLLIKCVMLMKPTDMLNSFEVPFTWTIKLVLHGCQAELCHINYENQPFPTENLPKYASLIIE